MVFCNRFVARTLFKAGAQHGHPLSSIPVPVLMQDISFLKQELLKAKKRFPHLLLVDVQSAQGDVVKIEL